MFRNKFKSIPLLVLAFIITSCNKDYYSVGIELFDNQFQNIKSEVFPVFSYQEALDKVQTNNLTNVHLGSYNHEFFGKLNSSFISQLDVTSLENFGDFSQDQENEGSLTDIRVINEEEQLTAVYLDLPFFSNTNDSDNDGVIDLYDIDPNNSSSDSDNDGLSDIIETQAGTNPLSPDTDNDGILDPDDTEIDPGVYNVDSQVYEIDSIFGNRNAEFDLKVFELTYYLSSLDPSNNFETFKEYYSDDDFYKQGYYGKSFFDERVKLNYEEIPVLYTEDDPSTEDVNEVGSVRSYETPRIRVELDKDYFQRAIINKEGSDELINQNNFNNFFKGLIIKADNYSDDIYMLLDILNSRLVLEYNYNFYNTNGTDDVTDDIIERKKKSNTIPLGGVTINLYDYNNFDQSIIDEIDSSTNNNPSEKIYINGSKFISKLRLFSNNNATSSELDIFKTKNVLINEANIILYLDDVIHNSNFEFLPKRLYLYSFDSGAPIEDYNKDFTVDYQNPINSNKYLFGGFLQYDSNNNPVSYKFNITNHVSNIIRYDSLNIDLGLTLTADIENGFLRSAYKNGTKLNIPDASVNLPFPIALFGSNTNSDLAKKLKLEVLYTEY
jgi:hypothetical protein